MKKILTLLTLLPLFANAQVANDGFNFGSLIGVLVGIGVMLLIFLVLRQLVLWYWKIDKIVAYQEQNIITLQSVYNTQKEILKQAKEQTELLRKIRDKIEVKTD
ncbi:hypothetical protein [Pedobacter alluvionis]|uniref:Uncharacterized protein n=1 Tax=Pedobacter alluvionis TaxID=475253 RepID=A0A497YAF2_9SPHI|nr:hypothetical protein [Pedobacter alluvionis]RLJ79436.1 hypothetical protein BCL90_0132 [Pedobacter alluvionis]TFB30786.1 hypothetical protein E3V97_09105 [Pedobacter alluvionis]